MKYEHLSRFNDMEFKRLVGVPRPLFSKMITILEASELAKKKSGRPHSLTIENQLLRHSQLFKLLKYKEHNPI